MATASDGATQRSPGEGLVDRIRDAILEGSFAPQQRLIESDLSERFAATRAAVRTALLELAGEGLVERLPNRGARVRAITVQEAVEIAEVRVGLECLCARKAAERITPGAAEALRQLRESIRTAVQSGHLHEYAQLNQELDRALRELSGHATATALLERLLAQSARHQFRLAFHPGRAHRSALEHIAIIDAVLDGDADAAESATRAHLWGIIGVLNSLGER